MTQTIYVDSKNVVRVKESGPPGPPGFGGNSQLPSVTVAVDLDTPSIGSYSAEITEPESRVYVLVSFFGDNEDEFNQLVLPAPTETSVSFDLIAPPRNGSTNTTIPIKTPTGDTVGELPIPGIAFTEGQPLKWRVDPLLPPEGSGVWVAWATGDSLFATRPSIVPALIKVSSELGDPDGMEFPLTEDAYAFLFSENAGSPWPYAGLYVGSSPDLETAAPIRRVPYDVPFGCEFDASTLMDLSGTGFSNYVYDHAPGDSGLFTYYISPNNGPDNPVIRMVAEPMRNGDFAKGTSAHFMRYTPTTSGNWSTSPASTGLALDELAARIAALEAV